MAKDERSEAVKRLEDALAKQAMANLQHQNMVASEVINFSVQVTQALMTACVGRVVRMTSDMSMDELKEFMRSTQAPQGASESGGETHATE